MRQVVEFFEGDMGQIVEFSEGDRCGKSWNFLRETDASSRGLF